MDTHVTSPRYRQTRQFLPQCPRFPDDLELFKKILKQGGIKLREPPPYEPPAWVPMGRGGVKSGEPEDDFKRIEAKLRKRRAENAAPAPAPTPASVAAEEAPAPAPPAVRDIRAY